MNKIEIAEILRKEVGELEVAIQKLQGRCERLKRFVLDLEEEIEPSAPPKKALLDGKFREVVDRVFGEEPRKPKR